MRGRQQGKRGCDTGIANPEQRAGARRFQHHLVPAPAQIGKPRQHDRVGIAEISRSRPVIGNLRFDDDLVVFFAGASEAVFQKPAPGQSPDQEIDFLVDRTALLRKRGERQPHAQILRAFHRSRAELSQGDRMAVEAREDISVRLRFERDVGAQPGGNRR